MSNDLITIDTNPPHPTLEQIWEGRVDIEVRGPTGRAARATITFESGASFLASKQLPSIPLPITPRGWHTMFDRDVRRDERLQKAYDEAKRCRIEVAVEEIGTASLVVGREFTPIRWRLQIGRETVMARLLNDGAIDEITVDRYSFNDPLVKISIDRSTALADIVTPEDGGLLVAHTASIERCIIAPPTVRTFQDLACRPRIPISGRSVHRVLELLTGARRWGTARLPGGIAAVTRQHAVLDAFAHAITAQICGDDWLRVERAFSLEDIPERAAQRLAGAVASRPEHRVIAQSFLRDLDWYNAATPTERVKRFSGITKRTLADVWPGSAVALEHPGEFVLRLVSDPAGFLTWAGARAEPGIRGLFSFQVYTRAARCLVLLVHRALSPAPIRAGHLYEGWTWDLLN